MKRAIAAMLRAIPDVFLLSLPYVAVETFRMIVPILLSLFAIALGAVDQRSGGTWLGTIIAALLISGAVGYAADRAAMRAKIELATDLMKFIGQDSSAEITVSHVHKVSPASPNDVVLFANAISAWADDKRARPSGGDDAS